MLETEIKINRFLLEYCRLLVIDVPEERLAERPLPGVNHPAWILGHLATSADAVAGLLNVEKRNPENWKTLFGPGTKLTSSRSDYPTKVELLESVVKGYGRAHELIAAASPEELAQPNSNPRFKQALPSVGDALAFVLSGHMGVHLGQLSAWRRMIGLSPLF